jgi:hypothetical protein
MFQNEDSHTYIESILSISVQSLKIIQFFIISHKQPFRHLLVIAMQMHYQYRKRVISLNYECHFFR